MADIGLTVPFSSLAGSAETRWLRLVQVGAAGNIATMDEAADLIDRLYNVSPCETGTEGTGGEAADDSNLPDEDAFLQLAAQNLGELCADQDHWDAQVDLLRSHQTPSAWQARSATATLISTELVTESKTETVTLDGTNHYDLEYPYHGGLTVRGADVVDVRGSTVNFARPATGRVRISYTTRYERLTFRVPATPDEHGQAQAEPAAIIVFWDGRAAQIDLRQPETDDSIDAAELARLCRRSVSYQVVGDCWQTVEHYSKCTCTDRDAPGHEWRETASAPCPEGIARGSHIGTVRKLDAYVMCPEDIDQEMRDPAFYRRTCCHPVPVGKQLPGCRKYYELWRGGEQIENGPDYWREIYGSDVRLVAVSPPDGICGQKITEWEVNKRNCCDGVIPLSPRPDNPTEMSPGRSYNIGVLNGRPDDITWRLFGGLEFPDGTTTARGPGLTGAIVRARDSICPQPRIVVDDGCDPLTMTFVGQASEPLHLSSEDEVIYSNTQFYVQAVGGVPPYMWIIGGGIIVRGFSADGSIAYLQTKGTDEWCVEDITVSDQCGTTATCTIRNASTGVWANWPWDDGCASPTGEMFPKDPSAGISDFSLPSRGYRIRTSSTDWGSCNYYPQPRTCPPGTWFTTGERLRFTWMCAGWGGELGDDGCCRNPRTGRGIDTRSEYIAAVQKWICHD